MEHMRAGELQQARTACDALLSLNPEHAEVLLLAGRISQGQGRLEEAAEFYNHVLSLEPAHHRALYNLGVLLQRRNRLEEARVNYERAISARPNYTAALNNLGIIYRQQGKFKRALRCYRKAISIRPDYHEAHNNTGMVLKELGRHQAALEHYEQALTLKPDYAEAMNNIAVVYEAQEQFEPAEEHYRKAIGINPEYTRAVNNLGALLQGCGRLDEALDCYRKAISIHLKRPVSTKPPGGPLKIPQAKRALVEAREILTAAQIPFFLATGTLLGIIRDGDLLPHDKDMDIGVFWDVSRPHLYESLVAGDFGCSKKKSLAVNEDNWQLSFIHRDTNVTLDVFFFRPDGDFFLCGIDHQPEPILSRPSGFGLKTINWEGLDWQVPDDCERYFADLYGSDWRIPDPNFDTIVSSKCQVPSSKLARRCYGYNRLFERLCEGKLAKVSGYCRQLLTLEPDPFLERLLPEIEQMADTQNQEAS